MLLALSQIRHILVKNCKKILAYKLLNLFKMQILNNQLKNIRLLKMIVVNQLPKEYNEKNDEIFA